MRTLLSMTVVVVVGVVLSTAAALAHLGAPLSLRPPTLDLPAESGEPEPGSSETLPDAAAQSDAKPLAVVDEQEFHFGHLRNKTENNRHTFLVRNEGQAPLEFVGASVSCSKCTFVDIPDAPVPPGGSAKVVVRWNIDTYEDHFRQSATVQTNDPEHESLRFVITGKVVRPLEVEPKQLVLSNVQVGQPAEAKLIMAAFFSDDLKVLNHTFTEAATADRFAVSMSPLSKEMLPEGAKSGVELTVKIAAGLPVGPFAQTLKITTNLEEEPETSVPINGQVAGAVSFHGPGWEQDLHYLNMGNVAQSRGDKRVLNLLIRGNDLAGLELEPAETDEDVLQVSYGKITELKQGTLARVALTIEVPPGSPLVNHMGGKAKLAEILLPTNKPALGRIKVSVKFAVVAD